MVSQGRDTECARFSWPRREVCERCGVTSSLPLTFTSSFETKPTISIQSSLTPLPSRSQLPRPSHGTPAAERGTQGHLSGPMGSLDDTGAVRISLKGHCEPGTRQIHNNTLAHYMDFQLDYGPSHFVL